jgi:hypothetical protein
MPMGADVEIGVEPPLGSAEDEGPAEELEGEKIAIPGEIIRERDRVPGAEEEPVGLLLEHLGRGVIGRLEDVFESFLVHEHGLETLPPAETAINPRWPAIRRSGGQHCPVGPEMPVVPVMPANLSIPRS